MSEESVVSAEKQNNYRLPHQTTLQHCAKLSIVEDKPIMFDYWSESIDKKIVGVIKKNQDHNSKYKKLKKP